MTLENGGVSNLDAHVELNNDDATQIEVTRLMRDAASTVLGERFDPQAWNATMLNRDTKKIDDEKSRYAGGIIRIARAMPDTNIGSGSPLFQYLATSTYLEATTRQIPNFDHGLKIYSPTPSQREQIGLAPRDPGYSAAVHRIVKSLDYDSYQDSLRAMRDGLATFASGHGLTERVPLLDTLARISFDPPMNQGKKITKALQQ